MLLSEYHDVVDRHTWAAVLYPDGNLTASENTVAGEPFVDVEVEVRELQSFAVVLLAEGYDCVVDDDIGEQRLMMRSACALDTWSMASRDAITASRCVLTV